MVKDPSRLVRFLARDLLDNSPAHQDTRLGEDEYQLARAASDRGPPPRRSLPWLAFSLEGRITRFSWWMMTLIVSLLSWGLTLAVGYLPAGWDLGAGLGIGDVLVLLWSIPALWIHVAVQVKRWHDLDMSGYWVFFNLVPCVGIGWTIVQLGFVRGTIGPNRFGDRPV